MLLMNQSEVHIIFELNLKTITNGCRNGIFSEFIFYFYRLKYKIIYR